MRVRAPAGRAEPVPPRAPVTVRPRRTGRPAATLAALLAVILLTACWPGATAGPDTPATPAATARPSATEPIPSPTPPPQATATVGLPWATPGGPTPSPMPVALRNEITDAYLRYWKVRSDALYDLNADLLPQVLAGPELERDRQEIARLRSQGQAAVTRVEHRFQIVYAQADRALVFDEFDSRSYFVDAGTKAPPAPTPDVRRPARILFELQKLDGSWKVTDVDRYE